MNKLIAILLLLTLNSCTARRGNGIEFTIENKSDFAIENVRFTTSEKLLTMEFNEIRPNQSVSDFLSMKNNKSDGSYVLEILRANGKKEVKGWGYYTNGGALDRSIFFEIKNDTIIAIISGLGY